jgi:hypothetical protein
MANAGLGVVLRQLGHLRGTQEHAGISDAHLLERFVRLRDEAAFEVLLWRYGPGECGRVILAAFVAMPDAPPRSHSASSMAWLGAAALFFVYPVGSCLG